MRKLAKRRANAVRFSRKTLANGVNVTSSDAMCRKGGGDEGVRKSVCATTRKGANCRLRYLINRHDVIMHYINVITNSGNLKQPGRDTILIETTTTATISTTTGVILALIRRPAPILFCFVCLFVSCLLRDFTLASGKACAPPYTQTRACDVVSGCLETKLHNNFRKIALGFHQSIRVRRPRSTDSPNQFCESRYG